MYRMPNVNADCSETKTKNDLYRKFKDYFIGATEKEFRQYDLYGREGYISVNPAMEEAISNTLAHQIDEIVPIVGAAGVGKTYMLLYCLKEYYDIEDIPTNNPVLLPKNGAYDLVYYSDFNITEHAVLKDSTALCLAKIKAMYDYILSQQYFEIGKVPDIEDYILKNKREVNFYTEENKEYQMALFRLTTLLCQKEIPIKNVVFIFDDLESLTEKQQFAFMDNFLTLFENLKSKSDTKYCSKFFFSLRNNTYYNIYRKDFYNTHRASRALYLTVVPSLSQIFQKRFEIILKSSRIKAAGNEKSWESAKDILIKIADRVDNSYSNLLLRLNNNNISKALDDFLKIISNRRWTQKNVNPTASFTIETEKFYINDTNILRILSMEERNIYYQTTATTIRCILPNPGKSCMGDLISFLVLRAFKYINVYDREDPSISSKLLCAADIVDVINDCFTSDDESVNGEKTRQRQKEVEKIVNASFEYYEDNRFIHKNINPQMEEGKTKYYMLPRGEYIFDLFFSQMILFTIFRDAYLWDDRIFSAECSSFLSFDDLLKEALKYEAQLLEIETKFFQKIQLNGKWRRYISCFGDWSVSHSFLYGIDKTIQQFYRNSVPQTEIKEEYDKLENEVKLLTNVFDMAHEDEIWF